MLELIGFFTLFVSVIAGLAYWGGILKISMKLDKDDGK